jgi:mannonate dehydratase
MRETWRWFGPPDPITLAEVRQTGAGHRQRAASRAVRRGLDAEVRSRRRKAEIEAAGLTWDVIESIPVSEAIKTARGRGRRMWRLGSTACARWPRPTGRG